MDGSARLEDSDSVSEGQNLTTQFL
jgi:hypothetical protein